MLGHHAAPKAHLTPRLNKDVFSPAAGNQSKYPFTAMSASDLQIEA